MTSGPADEPVPPGGEAGTSSRADTGPAVPDDPEQLKEKIAQTREQLGETVNQLAAKTDVKARAQAKAADLTQRAKDKADQVRQQAAIRADSARSQLADQTATARQQAASASAAGREQLQSRATAVGAPLWAAAPDPLKRAVAKGTEGARQHRKPLAIVAGVLIIGAVVVRWWTRR